MENRIELKRKVKELREKGKTYSEIQNIIGRKIPKSTLSYWCRDVKLPLEYHKRIEKIVTENAQKGRQIALIVNRIKREKYLKSVADRNKSLVNLFLDVNVGKIALAMLYLGDGCKTTKGSLMFANSNPFIISLFMDLLRRCYNIDERKFRCTLQCRADQDVENLEKFWFGITKIPLSQFYRARIDKRTIGKPSKKPDYKGVCRIDYFSADLFYELMQTPKTIYKGPLA